MDDSITVPRRAVSPPAAHRLSRRRVRMLLHCFVLKETEIFQKKKQTNKQAKPSPAGILLPRDKTGSLIAARPPGR